ncbi:MAG: hypothetical protein KJ645_08885, partial [Planctomycetes bacterium]|nr:hypothetical protein [Planctomycetota bacterium]
ALYFMFEVRNPSITVDLEHAYAMDQLSGPYADFQVVPGYPPFQVNAPYPGYDLGPLPAGQSITIKYKVTVDPSYDETGFDDEIVNSLTVYADGPDSDADPDPIEEGCNNAEDTIGPVVADVMVPALFCKKLTYVRSADGTYYPGQQPVPPQPVPEVHLPENIVYPIEVYFFMEVANDGEITLPLVEIADVVVQNLGIGIPAGIDMIMNPPVPDWDVVLDPGESWYLDCVITLDNHAEAELLASHDEDPQATDMITNRIKVEQKSFEDPDVCGIVGLMEDQETARVGLVPIQTGIPALNEWGVIIMIVLLSGMIVWRSMRQT